jgi:hypothetical protein
MTICEASPPTSGSDTSEVPHAETTIGAMTATDANRYTVLLSGWGNSP